MKHILKDIVCCSKDCQLVIVICTILNIGPQLNYIFIADVLDYLNNSKARNESLFSEYFTVQLYFSWNPGGLWTMCIVMWYVSFHILMLYATFENDNEMNPYKVIANTYNNQYLL